MSSPVEACATPCCLRLATAKTSFAPSAFRLRLEQAVATLRRGSEDRQLVLLLDAIDNANEIARDRNQDSFPRLLLQSLEHGAPIVGLQVVVSARTHRRLAATGEISADEVELEPFVERETRAFLRARVSKLTETMVQVGQARSKGNARVLEHLVAEPDLLAPSEIHEPIVLDDLIQHRIDQALVEARKLGNADRKHPRLPGRTGHLATARSTQGVRAGQRHGRRRSRQLRCGPVATPGADQAWPDVPRRAHRRPHSAEVHAGDAASLRQLATNLFAMQSESVYAATTLPDLLLQLEDGEKLFQLAFDERLPASITGTVGQQTIRHARLRAAVAHAVRVDDLNRLVPLLVELSTLAAMEQRGTTYLLDYPDLVVASADLGFA